jgi:hypothetical protein
MWNAHRANGKFERAPQNLTIPIWMELVMGWQWRPVSTQTWHPANPSCLGLLACFRGATAVVSPRTMVVAMRALLVGTQVVFGVTVGETAAVPAAGTTVVAGAIDTHWGYLASVRFVSHLSGWSYPNGLLSEGDPQDELPVKDLAKLAVEAVCWSVTRILRQM